MNDSPFIILEIPKELLEKEAAEKYMSHDGIHFNEEGHRVMFGVIKGPIRQMALQQWAMEKSLVSDMKGVAETKMQRDSGSAVFGTPAKGILKASTLPAPLPLPYIPSGMVSNGNGHNRHVSFIGNAGPAPKQPVPDKPGSGTSESIGPAVLSHYSGSSKRVLPNEESIRQEPPLQPAISGRNSITSKGPTGFPGTR